MIQNNFDISPTTLDLWLRTEISQVACFYFGKPSVMGVVREDGDVRGWFFGYKSKYHEDIYMVRISETGDIKLSEYEPELDVQHSIQTFHRWVFEIQNYGGRKEGLTTLDCDEDLLIKTMERIGLLNFESWKPPVPTPEIVDSVVWDSISDWNPHYKNSMFAMRYGSRITSRKTKVSNAAKSFLTQRRVVRFNPT